MKLNKIFNNGWFQGAIFLVLGIVFNGSHDSGEAVTFLSIIAKYLLSFHTAYLLIIFILMRFIAKQKEELSVFKVKPCYDEYLELKKIPKVYNYFKSLVEVRNTHGDTRNRVNVDAVEYYLSHGIINCYKNYRGSYYAFTDKGQHFRRYFNDDLYKPV